MFIDRNLNLNCIKIHNIKFFMFYKLELKVYETLEMMANHIYIYIYIHKLFCNLYIFPLLLSFIVLLYLLLRYLFLPCCLFLWCTMIVELGLEGESYTLLICLVPNYNFSILEEKNEEQIAFYEEINIVDQQLGVRSIITTICLGSDT